jgi:hypothetical protein
MAVRFHTTRLVNSVKLYAIVSRLQRNKKTPNLHSRSMKLICCSGVLVLQRDIDFFCDCDQASRAF